MPFINNYFRILDIVRPNWPAIRKSYYCYLSLVSFFQHRFDTFKLLITGSFDYDVSFDGKEILDEVFSKTGAIFISIHSGPYTLAVKTFHDNFSSKRKIAVPFKHNYRVSVFKYFKKKLAPYGVELVALGGAMQKIDPILSQGGSTILFLDADLPANHVEEVNLFGRKKLLTTGPLWLARKYRLPIVPICVRKDKDSVHVKVFEPIKYKNKNQKEVMDEIAFSIEKMINLTLDQWQVYDRFLHDSTENGMYKAKSSIFIRGLTAIISMIFGAG